VLRFSFSLPTFALEEKVDKLELICICQLVVYKIYTMIFVSWAYLNRITFFVLLLKYVNCLIVLIVVCTMLVLTKVAKI
jgi:hypothetical protein